MKDSWLADITVAQQRCFLCLIVNIIFWESHQNVKAVWSTGGNSEFLLVIVFWQTGLCRPRWKTPWSSDPCASWGKSRIFPHEVQHGRKQETQLRCPTWSRVHPPTPPSLPPPSSQSNCWSGAKWNWPLSLYSKNEIHMKVPVLHWWQTELFPWVQLTVSEVSFIIKVNFGTKGVRIKLHVFSWVIFCMRAQICLLITMDRPTSCICATEWWKWADGDSDCAMTVWFLNCVGLSTSNTISLMKHSSQFIFLLFFFFRRKLRMIHNNSIS